MRTKGKNREPGLQENFVRNFTGRQPPPGVFFFVKCPTSLLQTRSDTSALRARSASIPPLFAPRIRAFFIEKLPVLAVLPRLKSENRVQLYLYPVLSQISLKNRNCHQISLHIFNSNQFFRLTEKAQIFMLVTHLKGENYETRIFRLNETAPHAL